MRDSATVIEVVCARTPLSSNSGRTKKKRKKDAGGVHRALPSRTNVGALWQMGLGKVTLKKTQTIVLAQQKAPP